MSKLRVTQVRSTIGRPEKHRRVIAALGLRRHQMTVEHEDTPSIRGMLHKVRHLVRVEEVK
jgi:large subunit ribosomal protein L30